MSTFGEELRRERELRQISLREISEATKVNIRYLEALERNDFRHLPGGVFNKGFVRAYAQYIGVDPEAMVNAYLLEEQQQTADGPRESDRWIRGQRSRESHADDGDVPRAEVPRRRGLLVTIVVAAVLLLALVALALRWTLREAPGEAAREREPASAVATKPPAEQAVPPDTSILESEASRETGREGEPDETVPLQATETDREPEAPAIGAAPKPDVAGPAAVPEATDEGRASETWTARVRLDRATDGRINCDNRRVEVLDGLAPGTELRFECSRFLLIRAADGGAVMVGVGDEPLAPLGEDGVPAEQRRMGASRGEVDS